MHTAERTWQIRFPSPAPSFWPNHLRGNLQKSNNKSNNSGAFLRGSQGPEKVLAQRIDGGPRTPRIMSWKDHRCLAFSIGSKGAENRLTRWLFVPGFVRLVIKTKAHHQNCSLALVEGFKRFPNQSHVIFFPDELIEWCRGITAGLIEQLKFAVTPFGGGYLSRGKPKSVVTKIENDAVNIALHQHPRCR